MTACASIFDLMERDRRENKYQINIRTKATTKLLEKTKIIHIVGNSHQMSKHVYYFVCLRHYDSRLPIRTVANVSLLAWVSDAPLSMHYNAYDILRSSTGLLIELIVAAAEPKEYRSLLIWR